MFQILIYNNCAWTKKNMGKCFDIPQGSFHGAEVCELVGSLILNKIEKEKISLKFIETMA